MHMFISVHEAKTSITCDDSTLQAVPAQLGRQRAGPPPPSATGRGTRQYGRETTRKGEVKLPRDAIRAVGKKSINENLQPPYVQTVGKARGKGGPTTPNTRSGQKLVQQMETGKVG